MVKVSAGFISVLISILSVPLACAVDSQSAPIKVGSYLTPGLITSDGSGLFNQLNNAIFNELGDEFELSLSSIKRARQGVSKGEQDVYFPELWENLPGDKQQYVVSNPIFYKRIVLFTLKDSELRTLSDLDSKLLGAVTGYSYGLDIKSNPRLKLVYQDNDVTNIRLLLNNRLAGVLGGFPGTVLAVQQHSAANRIHYDLNSPVAVLESFYVCTGDAKGIRLCNKISDAIASLQQKGVLQLNPQNGFSRYAPHEL